VEAISLEVLKSEPFQNAGFGRVGAATLRTELRCGGSFEVLNIENKRIRTHAHNLGDGLNPRASQNLVPRASEDWFARVQIEGV